MAFKIDVNQAFKNLRLGASKFMGMKGLKLKEASPEILLGIGIITMGGAVVSGIMAARHHDEIIDDHNERLEAAKAEYLYPEDYDEENPNPDVEPIRRTEKEIKHAVTREYCRTAAAMCKLYSRTALLMGFAVACFIGMHNIQAGRIAGLSGVCTGLREYISQYEQRNIELNGEESHRMCKYGYKEIEVEEEDPDNGEKHKVKKKVPLAGEDLVDKDGLSSYHDHLYWFNRNTSRMYKGRGAYDIMSLDAAETYIQNLVNDRGWATVNDALTSIAMEPTVEGMVEGWIKGVSKPVCFGHRDPGNQRALDGYSNTEIFLDFNADCNVYGMLMYKECCTKSELEKIKRLRESMEEKA